MVAITYFYTLVIKQTFSKYSNPLFWTYIHLIIFFCIALITYGLVILMLLVMRNYETTHQRQSTILRDVIFSFSLLNPWMEEAPEGNSTNQLFCTSMGADSKPGLHPRPKLAVGFPCRVHPFSGHARLNVNSEGKGNWLQMIPRRMVCVLQDTITLHQQFQRRIYFFAWVTRNNVSICAGDIWPPKVVSELNHLPCYKHCQDNH